MLFVPEERINVRPTLCLVVVGATSVELQAFGSIEALPEVDELVQVATSKCRFGGLAKVANRYLRYTACEVFGLVHADTTFARGSLTTFSAAARAGAAVGMVGRSLEGAYVWSKEVKEVTPVSTLDCCSIFIPTSFGLTFDDVTFDGLHCYTEDMCLQADKAGLRVEVVPSIAYHKGGRTFNAYWQNDYWQMRARLERKWAGHVFATT